MKWSGNDNYATPEYLYTALEREFGLDFDPCPLSPVPDQDGLSMDWTGRHVYCNPPWSDIDPWVEKALASRCLTVFVLPARTDTGWFHLLKDNGAELRFFRKRVHFVREGARVNPTDGTMVAVVRGRVI
jgi:site-specific DNA-methyltransferase (adenine-specific)